MVKQSSIDFSLRRDLLVFINYILEYGIKRSHRENAIPKTDLKRLSGLLSIPKQLKETDEGVSDWAERISFLALKMNLVGYDTKGSYQGYSSSEPSYPDNYIQINKENYEKYLHLTSAEKEFFIFDTLKRNLPNEFYAESLLGTTDRFSTWGSAVNGAAKMDLFDIRSRLFEILSSFEIDKEILFGVFVEKVKERQPDLILKKYTKSPKYYSFYEKIDRETETAGGKRFFNSSNESREVQDTDLDAFERVEGRYLAYFLEEISVMMQFVSLEYDEEFMNGEQKIFPMRPQFIKSFVVKKKLKAVLTKDYVYLNHLKITVTPDFKIFIESMLYPDHILLKIDPYTNELVRDVYVMTLELSKKKTIQSLAKDPLLQSPLNVLEVLNVGVPKNVAIEISEWTAHANKFLVYDNVVLLEIDHKEPELRKRILSEFSDFIIDQQNAHFLLMKNEEKLFSLFEDKLYFPKKIHHSSKKIICDLILCVPKDKKSKVCAKKNSKEQGNEKIVLNKSPFIALQSENIDFFNKLKKALQKEGVTPIVPDEKKLMCFVPHEACSKLSIVMKDLSKEFAIEY